MVTPTLLTVKVINTNKRVKSSAKSPLRPPGGYRFLRQTPDLSSPYEPTPEELEEFKIVWQYEQQLNKANEKLPTHGS
jgi:hypothetical protein